MIEVYTKSGQLFIKNAIKTQKDLINKWKKYDKNGKYTTNIENYFQETAGTQYYSLTLLSLDLALNWFESIEKKMNIMILYDQFEYYINTLNRLNYQVKRIDLTHLFDYSVLFFDESDLYKIHEYDNEYYSCFFEEANKKGVFELKDVKRMFEDFNKRHKR